MHEAITRAFAQQILKRLHFIPPSLCPRPFPITALFLGIPRLNNLRSTVQRMGRRNPQ